ncbi:unnamed protein product [Cuscuta campestris]|uniref:Cytochrome b5 heme-binding domain-containing protein n=1 Tax=Cuscuta campestris TaxID=132261 RepID=A0A484L7L5_9ASTE|nr:unnamed protein product [Cuscuta campestris]
MVCSNLWTPLTEAVFYYTGLSPTAFFTIAALMAVTYKVVYHMLGGTDDYMYVKKAEEAARRKPIQIGDLTAAELLAFNGSDPKKPLLMAIRGQIYDVSSSRLKFNLFYSIYSQLKLKTILMNFLIRVRTVIQPNILFVPFHL